MDSRHARLRLPRPELLIEMYDLISRGELPWLWKGGHRTFQEFQTTLQTEDFVQLAIEDRRTEKQVALISAYDVDLFNGIAYSRMVLLPQFNLRVWPLEGAVLFANLLFTRFNLRKLCGGSIDRNYINLRSGADRFFEIEGCLKNHFIIDGQPEDMYLGAVDQARWQHVGLPLLRRITAVGDV